MKIFAIHRIYADIKIANFQNQNPENRVLKTNLVMLYFFIYLHDLRSEVSSQTLRNYFNMQYNEKSSCI